MLPGWGRSVWLSPLPSPGPGTEEARAGLREVGDQGFRDCPWIDSWLCAQASLLSSGLGRLYGVPGIKASPCTHSESGTFSVFSQQHWAPDKNLRTAGSPLETQSWMRADKKGIKGHWVRGAGVYLEGAPGRILLFSLLTALAVALTRHWHRLSE